MKKQVLSLVFLFYLYSVPLSAEVSDLQDQIDEVKIMIEREQIINIELKAELAARETEVTELKLKLREIEEKIEAMKQEHNLSMLNTGALNYE